MRDEIWKPVVGYAGWYEVSSLGRVRRVLANQGATAGRILRQSNQGDYLCVTLYRYNHKEKISVHVIVAKTFHGSRPDGLVVNHKDTNKRNNHFENLEWATQARNVEHAIENGLHGGKPMPGESNGRAKLTTAQVREIREMKGVLGARAIAKRFGVSRSAIQHIHQGKNWAEWPADLQVREFPAVKAGVA